MNKKRWSLLVCLFLLVNMSGFGEILRMAVFQLDPFMTKVEGQKEPGGVTVEYWKNWLAPRMGYTLEVVGPFPVERAEKMLENGEVDVVSQLTKIPDREARFLFPETPLTQIITCIAVRPDSPIKNVDSPDVFFGKRIGFMEAADIPPFLIDPRIIIEMVANEDYRQINLNKLFAGRVDAVLDINYISYLYYLDERGYLDQLRILRLPVEPVNVYSIFRNDERGRKLRDQYDRANREGQKAGIFRQMTEKHLSGVVITP